MNPPAAGLDSIFEKTNEMSHAELQDTFVKILKGLRRSLRQSARLKKAKLPLNRINFYISLMDIGVQSFKKPGASRATPSLVALLRLNPSTGSILGSISHKARVYVQNLLVS